MEKYVHFDQDEIKKNPQLFIMSEIVKGETEEDITDYLVKHDFTKSKIIQLINQAKLKLEDDEIQDYIEKFNQKIEILKSFENYAEIIMEDDKSQGTNKKASLENIKSVKDINLDDWKGFEQLPREFKINTLIRRTLVEVNKILSGLDKTNPRRKGFISTVLFINKYLDWTNKENTLILLNLGFEKKEVEELLENFEKKYSKLTNEKTVAEELSIKIARFSVASLMRKGKLKKYIVENLMKAGWQEEIAWYFLNALELTPLLKEKSTEVQKINNDIFYYGEEIITPDEPSWGNLSNTQKELMTLRRNDFNEWRKFSSLFGFISFCLITPYTGILISCLISLIVVFLSVIILTLWFNEAIFFLLSKIRFLLIILGLIYSAYWVNKDIQSIGLLILSFIILNFLSFHILLFTREKVWLIKNRIMKKSG